MSVRGLRGERGGAGGVGRGRGCGRGRGRGKTQLWSWESYTPGPEVYQSLWRVKDEPAIVTPGLPRDCPIPNAKTRILDRRQTEDTIQRNFYVVEVTYQSGGTGDSDKKEVLEVDLSRILEYVSPAELERHENEQFGIEAEAEAVARRAEAEDIARRRLEKNARISGVGRGSRMLSGLARDMEVEMPTKRAGRPRGRRGRGRGRGRGGMVFTSRRRDDMREELVDADPGTPIGEDEDTERVIAETESEGEDEEADAQAQTSPDLMRSAFVANSALPVSPVAVNRSLSTSHVQRAHSEVSDIEDSDIELGDHDARSMSSAALQLRYEDAAGEEMVAETQEEDSTSMDEREHPNKRRRTESTASHDRIPEDAFRQTPLFQDRSSDHEPELDSSNEVIPEQAFHQTPLFQDRSSLPDSDVEDSIPAQPPDADTIHVITPRNGTTPHSLETHSDDDDAEEYVVESIIEHFHEGGKKYYLVKWEGYEDSHDWLPEEDLEGAMDLVEEYNERIRRRKEKREKTVL